MPKVAQSSVAKVKLYTSEFPQEFQATPRGELFCQICASTVTFERRSSVLKHRESVKHQNGKKALQAKQTILQPTVSVATHDELLKRVTRAFLSADIPLYKLTNPDMKCLFEYLGQRPPSEFSCRAKVLSMVDTEVERLKESLVEKDLFMIVDEADISGRKIVNTLVGDVNHPTKVYLISCKTWHSSMNQQTIVHTVDDVMKILGGDRNRFVLLLSDAARYMTAAGKVLKNLYPRLFHVTCVAHLLHNCAERVRHKFTKVDALIAAVKASVIKNKDRKEMYSEIGYPPEPVLTRWATWLKSAFYYAQHLPAVREIVQAYEGEGLLVSRAQAAVSAPGLSSELLAVKRDYESLVLLLEKCEAATYTIADAHRDLPSLSLGQDAAGIKSYLDKRLNANEDLYSIMNLKRTDISPSLYAALQQNQATSVSVERSFSMLKKMLCKDRNFKPENIEKYFFMLFNSRK